MGLCSSLTAKLGCTCRGPNLKKKRRHMVAGMLGHLRVKKSKQREE